MENTYNDLVDVYHNWNETEEEKEKRFRLKILELCQKINDRFGNVEDIEDEDDPNNGWGNTETE